MGTPKKIVIIAGPNGAGKTSFARQFLPREAGCPDFINVDLALARVTARVAQGGHDVEAAVVRRRFDAGWRHFQAVYRDLVNSWIVYDNAGPLPVPIASGDNP